MTDSIEQRVCTDYVQVGVLLAGEARCLQVLGGRRRPHRDGYVLAKARVCRGDLFSQPGRHWGGGDEFAGPGGQPVLPGLIVCCCGQFGEQVGQAGSHRCPVSGRRHAESRRGGEAGAEQDAKIARLAADLGQHLGRTQLEDVPHKNEGYEGRRRRSTDGETLAAPLSSERPNQLVLWVEIVLGTLSR